MIPADLKQKLTVSVPEAAELLGIGRDAAYAAAKRGDLPTLSIGRRLVVPVPRLLALVGASFDMSEARPATGPAAATTAPTMESPHARDTRNGTTVRAIRAVN